MRGGFSFHAPHKKASGIKALRETSGSGALVSAMPLQDQRGLVLIVSDETARSVAISPALMPRPPDIGRYAVLDIF